jgi:predicted metal-dependent hydrolase
MTQEQHVFYRPLNSYTDKDLQTCIHILEGLRRSISHKDKDDLIQELIQQLALDIMYMKLNNYDKDAK